MICRYMPRKANNNHCKNELDSALPLKRISLLLCNLSFFRPKNLRVAMSASWLQAHLLNKILFFMSCRRYTAAANALLYI